MPSPESLPERLEPHCEENGYGTAEGVPFVEAESFGDETENGDSEMEHAETLRLKSSFSHLMAAGLSLAAFTCWVVGDTAIKWAGGSRLPAYEMIALVGAVQAALLLGLGAARGRLGELWPKRIGRQAARSMLDLGNNLCVVVALRHLPLALFYILIFLAPMVTTVLAAGFLGERLEWRKGVLLVVGFAGVVVAVNPLGAGRGGDVAGYLACMVCVSCFSANMLLSRVMTQTEAPESLTFFSAVVMAVVGGAGMLWHAEPVTLGLAGLMVGIAAFFIGGSLCFFTALKHATAAAVSQFHYSQLLTGALMAFLLWGERPTVWMAAGAVLIVGAGWASAVGVGPREMGGALQG